MGSYKTLSICQVLLHSQFCVVIPEKGLVPGRKKIQVASVCAAVKWVQGEILPHQTKAAIVLSSIFMFVCLFVFPLLRIYHLKQKSSVGLAGWRFTKV